MRLPRKTDASADLAVQSFSIAILLILMSVALKALHLIA